MVSRLVVSRPDILNQRYQLPHSPPERRQNDPFKLKPRASREYGRESVVLLGLGRATSAPVQNASNDSNEPHKYGDRTPAIEIWRWLASDRIPTATKLQAAELWPPDVLWGNSALLPSDGVTDSRTPTGDLLPSDGVTQPVNGVWSWHSKKKPVSLDEGPPGRLAYLCALAAQ